ncbi:MAG TPA: Dyp-type peroxidase [Nodularia sp. (in: cyanobacteria)]|nr:Dyp-type peroxidase [Nodularia sp. (in: cyanobacteria)]
MAVRYQGLDPDFPEHRAILANTQAGILKGHGRDYSAFVFIRATAVSSIDEIVPLVNFHPQSAAEQYDLARQVAAGADSNQPFKSILFSATGFEKLRIPRRFFPKDIGFLRSMKYASRSILNDPPVNEWDSFFQKDIDILVIVASQDRKVIENEITSFIDCISSTFKDGFESHIIWSRTLRNSKNSTIDAFGFVDGISQPIFFKYDVDAYFQDNPMASWDPSIDPMNLVFVKDPVITNGFGSYAVFRQLKQDSQQFKKATQSVVDQLGISADYAEAQIFGRFRDGTPLISSPNPVDPKKEIRDFTYDQDTDGAKCPFHAHIRKVNVRSGEEDFIFRQIARRGVPYQTNTSPSEEGLLFLCYQQDIGRQFEFLQSSWMNEPKFPPREGDVGVDPVAFTKPNSQTKGQIWRSKWEQPSRNIQFSINSFVDLKGGEYLYCPSPTFISEVLAASRG